MDERKVRTGVNNMDIPKERTVAIVVNREWVNLHFVRMFLRQYENPEHEVLGPDVSHLVFAKILDSNDHRGLWVELNTEQLKEDA
jgi:hypothetical protein